MSDYTKLVDFQVKDALPTGDADKIVKGTEIETELDNIAIAIATKSNSASPTFTGTVTIPTLSLTTDLSVADGGTGASSLTDGGVLLGSGTGAITAMGVLADGEMIVGDGTTDPVAESGATLRTSIGVDAAGTDNSTDVTFAGTGTYISLSGQEITVDPITESDISDLGPYNNYSHPNHSGDVTSTGDGATVIANNAVTLAKMAEMATASLLGRSTAATGDPEVLSKATALALLNVEDGADVTDATNVNAAGALMDSEVDADIKTLSLPASTTISTFAATILDDATAGAVRTTIGAGVGDALTSGNLSQFAATTSAQLLALLSDETGTGKAVFATNPTLTGATLAGELAGADNTVSRVNLKDYGEVTNAIGSTGGGTQDIDVTAGNSVSATVDTSANTFTFSDPTASDEMCSFTLVLTNGGSQTVTWPASVDWPAATAPTLTAAGVDVLTFFTIDGGTIWHGAIAITASA